MGRCTTRPRSSAPSFRANPPAEPQRRASRCSIVGATHPAPTCTAPAVLCRPSRPGGPPGLAARTGCGVRSGQVCAPTLTDELFANRFEGSAAAPRVKKPGVCAPRGADTGFLDPRCRGATLKPVGKEFICECRGAHLPRPHTAPRSGRETRRPAGARRPAEHRGCGAGGCWVRRPYDAASRGAALRLGRRIRSKARRARAGPGSAPAQARPRPVLPSAPPPAPARRGQGRSASPARAWRGRIR